MKNSRQNKIATAKVKTHGKIKNPRQNKKVMANKKAATTNKDKAKIKKPRQNRKATAKKKSWQN